RLNNKRRPDAVRLPAEELRRRKLVRRSHFMTIVAAWIITVPAAALLSGVIFWGLSLIAL
ncbi:MAG: inorganic phosphate transporter, partial [Maritimibacter sp.]